MKGYFLVGPNLLFYDQIELLMPCSIDLQIQTSSLLCRKGLKAKLVLSDIAAYRCDWAELITDGADTHTLNSPLLRMTMTVVVILTVVMMVMMILMVVVMMVVMVTMVMMVMVV